MKNEKRSLSLKLRGALIKAGASEAQVAAAIAAVNPKAAKAVKLSRSTVKRVCAALSAPGSRCVLIRGKNSVRVFTMQGLGALSDSARAGKPWEKAKKATTPS